MQNLSARKSLTKDTPTCAHCGAEFSSSASSLYCCAGCDAAAAVLRNNNAVEAKAPEKYAYLDRREFRDSYATESGRRLDLYLEGVNCVSCVSRIEKISERIPGVEALRVDFPKSLASVRISPEGSFAAVAAELARLGYAPHPVKQAEEEAAAKRDERRLLLRLGVAAACSGNIMLFAIALYAGADSQYRELFRWGSFVLTLPVLAFSAVPFYQSAYSALRARAASIDIPIVFGLLAGSAVSTVNILRGSDVIYFDTIASLVFLLLATRVLLRKVSSRAESASRLVHSLLPARAHLYNPATGATEETNALGLRPGDMVRVLPYECYPADGVVTEGESEMNRAMLTGEALPVAIGPGDAVAAGAQNESAPVIVRVVTAGAETRIGKILRSLEEELANKAPIVNFTDRVGNYFVAATLALTVIAYFVGLATNFNEAVQRALAMAIIVCPCTFALATPLAFSLALARAARLGIVVRSAEVLERLADVREIFFDKTGTLTEAKLRVEEIRLETDTKLADIDALAALEAKSTHPIALAVQRYFADMLPLPVRVENFRETKGKGLEGVVNGIHYAMRASLPHGDLAASGGTQVTLFRDGKPIAHLRLGDNLRPDAYAAVTALRDSGYGLRIFSGDSPASVNTVGRTLRIAAEDARGGLSPEQKSVMVSASPLSLAVGDGANDALALASAHVGIAVQGGMEVSMKAAGVFCTRPGVTPVVQILTIARETMRIIRRNLGFAILYNVVGIGFAIGGYLTPLHAAILMPLSAATVFLSTIAGTRELRAVSGEEPA